MFCEFASCHKIVVSPKIVLWLSQDRLWIWAQVATACGPVHIMDGSNTEVIQTNPNDKPRLLRQNLTRRSLSTKRPPYDKTLPDKAPLRRDPYATKPTATEPLMTAYIALRKRSSSNPINGTNSIKQFFSKTQKNRISNFTDTVNLQRYVTKRKEKEES